MKIKRALFVFYEIEINILHLFIIKHFYIIKYCFILNEHMNLIKYKLYILILII